MNKLVIIGNGFDLAHGLKTSYKDFILWHINKVYQQNYIGKTESKLIVIETNFDKTYVPNISKYDDYISLKKSIEKDGRFRLEIKGKYDFINRILNDIELYNWVDIEKLYYDSLVKIFTDYEPGFHDRAELNNLNKALDLIRVELEEYLSTISTQQMDIDLPPEIVDIFRSNMISDMPIANNENLYFLNFNYTNTIINYRNKFGINLTVNYIHGKLNEKNNPIIFGYGDETDKNYETIENLNENEFTRHFKSFSYLTTSNYQDLFKFLDSDEFDVHVMGHSLGLSDRLLFNHIFEHPHFRKVQLYYYEYEKDGVVVNDFFQKTQELSRHFKLDSKHKMRTKVVPFSESKPLNTYKP